MSTTATVDEIKHGTEEHAGSQLARIREKKGFTREYVAGKLHLRVRLIELLEEDDYKQMPEPVFIMGYLRAYAKLLGVAPEPFIVLFNAQYSLEKKPEKALWQSRRESNRGELVVRWFTALVAVTAVLAVSFWWQKNKEEQPFFSAKNKSAITTVKTASAHTKDNVSAEPEIKLTDLSKMQSMFSSNAEDVPAEKQGD